MFLSLSVLLMTMLAPAPVQKAPVWKAGPTVRLASPREFEVVAFSPDGTLAALRHEKAFKLWDLEHNRERFGASDPNANVGEVAFSPDGGLVAVAGSRLALYEAATGKQVAEVPGPVQSLTYHPTRPLLALTDGQTVREFDPRLGKPGRAIEVPSAENMPFRGGPASLRLTYWGDRLVGWRITILQLPCHPMFNVEMLDLSAGASLWRVTTVEPSMQCQPRGTGFFSRGPGGFTLRDGETGKEVAKLIGAKDAHWRHSAVSPEGRWVAGSSWNNAVSVWDRTTATRPDTFQATGNVLQVGVSHDGKAVLAAVWKDNGLQLERWLRSD